MQQGSSINALQKAHQLYESGQVVEAVDILKHIIETRPEVYQAWLLLSKYLYEVGYFEEAYLVIHRSEEFDPLKNEFQLIQQAIKNNSIQDAEKVSRTMLRKQPGHPKAIFSLAHIASLSPTPESAITILNAGLAYNPASVSLTQMLIELLDINGLYQEAINKCKEFRQNNNKYDAHWMYIMLLHKHGQYEEVLNATQKARDVAGDDVTILSQIDLVRAEAQRILGHRKASEISLRKSLKQNSNNAAAWWALAELKNCHFSDSDRQQIKTLIDSPHIDSKNKCLACFALAKTSEQTSTVDDVMRHYNQANQRYPTAYDATHVENDFNRLMTTYDGENLFTQASTVNFNKTPIFIVGLPRSGSTLVEQILASHSKIEGTVEQPTIASVEKQARSIAYKNYQTVLHECIGQFTAEQLAGLGSSYINNGSLYREFETEFFTDKNPFNFRNIGFIHKILPHAKIIDVRRNPLDCGLSLYKQYFTSGVDFSYDLKDIGAFYNSYLTLMSHWGVSLSNKVYTLHYELLIANPEQQVNQLLDFIGLDFESACLDFHNTERAIRTASSEQVREPINTKGVGGWKAVSEYLEPLKEALGEATLAQFKPYL